MKLKKIAENHGLTKQGVDYALTQYQIVINEITHGMMSKLSYDAKDIIRVAQERWCDTCELKEQESVPIRFQPTGADNPELKCGACLGNIVGLYNYCPWCGKKVKWNVDCLC